MTGNPPPFPSPPLPRWYHLRKQMGRALALQYRYSVGVKVLGEWRGVARHRRLCKAKAMGLLYKTGKQVGGCERGKG